MPMVRSTGPAPALLPLAQMAQLQLNLTQTKAPAVQGMPLASAVAALAPNASPEVTAPMVQSTGVAAALQPLAPVVQLPLTQSKAQAVQGTPLASAVPAPVPKGSPDVSAPMVGSTAPALQPLVPVAQVPLSFPQAKAPAVHGTPLASGVPTPVPKASQEVSKMREHKA